MAPSAGFLSDGEIALREVRRTDVNENYRGWLNDPAVNRYLETRFQPRSLENITRYVEAMDGDPDNLFLAICLAADGRHVGNIKLGPINWRHRHGDVSLFIGERTMWGRGIGHRAIALVCRFAFQQLNLNRLTAGCYARNIGSARAFEKAGFKREGLLPAHWFCDGEYVDEILLGLSNSEWGARQRSAGG